MLLYHVAPEGRTTGQLRSDYRIDTLLEGAQVKVVWNRVIDGDRDDRDARIVNPKNVKTGNGVVQSVNRVLRPLDLDPSESTPDTVVDIVVGASGAEGFDHNGRDYDLLREALVATGLVNAVAEADDITVFAPRDWAFLSLARDLGFKGHDEAAAFAFLAEATGFKSAEDPGLLDDVLLYHVSPGAKSLPEIRRERTVTTLLEGATFKVFWDNIVDGDRNDRNARFLRPSNIVADNGTVHTVSKVIRPIDL